MSEVKAGAAATSGTTSVPGPRAYLFGLGIVGVVLAIAIGTPAALVVATGRTCACAQPPDLVVLNAGTSPVTVTWQHVGLSLAPDEPEAGTMVVEACGTMNTVLPQGTVHVLVTSASEAQEFDLEIPHQYATDPFAWRVIREDGGIEDPGRAGPTSDPLSTCAADDVPEN